MKTRSQVKAGRRREDIDREREIKQRIKLKKRIKSRSAASSCSSSFPTQLINDGKSCRANGLMESADSEAANDLLALSGGEHASSNGKAASSKGKPASSKGKPVEAHDWSIEEIEWLLLTFAEDEWKKLHEKSEREYSRDISVVMNKAFNVKHFTEENVRSKVRTLHILYTNHIDQSDDTQSSASTFKGKVGRTINLLAKHREILSSVFIANKSTTSVLQQQEPKEWTEPEEWTKAAALRFMSLHRSTPTKLVGYSRALDSSKARYVLDVFPVVLGFKERKQMLDRLVRETKQMQ